MTLTTDDCWVGYLNILFFGALRLMVSTLPEESLQVVERLKWKKILIKPLSIQERGKMIAGYLLRFGKKLDDRRLDRLSKTPTSSNPLYLKILLDELRVTGTHDLLDDRLSYYLEAADIPSLLQKVLKRYQKDYEQDHPDSAPCMNNLGILLMAAHRYNEAEHLFIRALSINEKNFGKHHVHIADGLNNLASLMKVTNHLLEAKPMFERALAIYEQILSHNHPKAATVLINLAAVLSATNNKKEAEGLLKRALNICEKCYGAKHPAVALK